VKVESFGQGLLEEAAKGWAATHRGDHQMERPAMEWHGNGQAGKFGVE
jgi:hypothetical protein